MKLAFFDFDRTLRDGDTIGSIFDNIESIQTELQQLYHPDFRTLLIQKLKLLKNFNIHEIMNLQIQTLHYFPGAKQLIQTLKANGWTVIVLSGGFSHAIQTAQKELGFDTFFCNDLVVEQEKITGELIGFCLTDTSKGEIVQKIRELTGVSKQNTIAIGDGKNDVSMFQEVGFSIAFCSQCEALRAISSICIDEPNLITLLNYIK